jgi:hypothetical protein
MMELTSMNKDSAATTAAVQPATDNAPATDNPPTTDDELTIDPRL